MSSPCVSWQGPVTSAPLTKQGAPRRGVSVTAPSLLSNTQCSLSTPALSNTDTDKHTYTHTHTISYLTVQKLSLAALVFSWREARTKRREGKRKGGDEFK